MAKASLVIMAAGMGSRYGGVKQIAGVGPRGEILMEYAIFDALRAFDATDVTEIFAQCPDPEGLGLAVSNRLKKAAGFHIAEVGA